MTSRSASGEEDHQAAAMTTSSILTSNPACEQSAAARTPPAVFKVIFSLVILTASGLLLFGRLGHYALWDDEAATALVAQGVWQSGDTTAVLGHNVAACRNGLLLRDLHERSTPPLAAYLAAPLAGLRPGEALGARLPFAVLGFICIAVLVAWLWKDARSHGVWLLFGAALLGNVSLFLFSRQCGYYAPALLASVALAYLYLHWDGLRRGLLIFALLSLALLACSYLNYAALYACLMVDYAIWGRRRYRLVGGDWVALFLPQLLLGLPLLWVWNPLQAANADYFQANGLGDRLRLFLMSCRDLNACEFGVGVLLLAAPVLALFRRGSWLGRGSVVAVVYLAVVSLLSPQPLAVSRFADVRYLVPLIPLCIALQVGVLQASAASGRC